MKTLGVIGASYLQLPLVKRAKEMGLRVICFAWADGAVCKDYADVFYPISITDKDAILAACQKEEIDGVTSIASDVAVPTIAYIAAHMGLIGNSIESAAKSTNKYLMRQALLRGGVLCPKFVIVDEDTDLSSATKDLRYPLIVKPTDRSGSIGVTELFSAADLESATCVAIADSFCRKAVIEECITDMHEVSVEGISWKGKYNFLQITDKVTTGAPHYVELGHHQPARLTDDVRAKIVVEVEKCIESLEIKYGASHTELMITKDGRVYVTEVGARMGGDFIGSHLVKLSTGYDFLGGVIKCALGDFDGVSAEGHLSCSGVWFYAPQTRWVKDRILGAALDSRIVESELQRDELVALTRSADRSGYFIYQSSNGRYHAPGEG